MSTFSPDKKEDTKSSTAKLSTLIAYHKTAAKHHKEASKHHTEAAKFHENGKAEKAAQSTVVAQGHSSIAKKALKDLLKHHTIISKT